MRSNALLYSLIKYSSLNPSPPQPPEGPQAIPRWMATHPSLFLWLQSGGLKCAEVWLGRPEGHIPAPLPHPCLPELPLGPVSAGVNLDRMERGQRWERV